MTHILFDPAPASPPGRLVAAAVPTPEVQALAVHLAQGWSGQIRLGTSSWHFPGWGGLVWAGSYSEALVARQGLAAYARRVADPGICQAAHRARGPVLPAPA